MNIAVVIASTTRPIALAATINSLFAQMRQADRIVISVTSLADLPNIPLEGIQVVYSTRGASVQRNRGADALPNDTDVVVFLDDDVILHPAYLSGVASIFAARPEAALIMGHLVVNGNVSVSDANERLRNEPTSTHYAIQRSSFGDVYGCNMCVRFDVVRKEPFDERLPLYSYMEDVDFGTRARRHGHIGYYYGSLAAHLRVPEGRVCHQALGFSEVMNPAYLAGKGTIPHSHALSNFIFRKPAGNLVRSITGPRRLSHWDRLRGNISALRLLCLGQINPEHAETIEVISSRSPRPLSTEADSDWSAG